MEEGRPPVVGRAHELGQLARAVEAAARGSGATVLLVGEAGVGKSRLLEASAELAREADMTVAWGRCWEAGGAPAFWPWTQVLRALLRQRPDGAGRLERYRRRELARLVPELGQAAPIEEEVPFALLDAVAAWLSELAATSPVWVGLEDLHAADIASLALLDHLTRMSWETSLLLVGSAREPDFAPEADVIFRRAARDATVLKPAPLAPRAVRAYVERELGPVDPKVLDRIQSATGGNALFMIELVRWLRQTGPETAPDPIIPPTVRATIAARLGRLPDEVRHVLAVSALVGREVDPARIEGAFHLAFPSAFRIASEHALGFRTTRGWRFAHGVIADVLAESLPLEEAQARHGQYAEHLARLSGAACAEIAYHYARAGPARASDAARAHLQAARASLANHAHEDAIRFAAEVSDSALVPEARILAGMAQIAAGRPDAGQTTCRLAFEEARRRGDGRLMAEAALADGAVYRFVETDAILVGMLEQARDALDDEQAGLRARVRARLAAALQPADDPSGPARLALDAIREAEAAGDEHDLMLTLRAGASALVDVAPAEVRSSVDRRHLALASRMGSPFDIVKSSVRLAFDTFELGALTEAECHLDRVRSVCESDRLPPSARWQAPAVRALRALWVGDLEAASEGIARTRDAARAYDDTNAHTATVFQRSELARRLQDPERMLALEPEFDRLWSSSPIGRVLARAYWGGCLAAVGEADRARVAAPLALVRQATAFRDRTNLHMLAQLAALYADRETAASVVALIDEDEVRNLHLGVVGMAWIGPSDATRALAIAVRDGTPPIPGARTVPRGVEASSGQGPRLEIADEGDVWRLSYEGRVLRVRAIKGMKMLAYLVDRPGQDIHVLDLVHLGRRPAPVDRAAGDELIDDQAREAYRRRAAELREELEAAEAANDLGRVDHLRIELEALTDALLASTGLGGRRRRTAGTEERARQNVKKRMTDALRKIGAMDPEVGRHLDRSVKTGRLCRYDP